jgi:hypothetical protein
MEPQHALCALPTGAGAVMAVPTQKEVMPPWVLPPPGVLLVPWPCSGEEGEGVGEEGEGEEGEGEEGGGAAVATISRQPSLPLIR